MTITSKEQATADCHAIGERIGKALAKSIMELVFLHDLDPDQMEGMVGHAIDVLRRDLLSRGADPEDTETIGGVVLFALVREGGRLARTMTWEAGTA